MTFSEHLYQLRVLHRLSQREVAEMMGVNTLTYQRYEYGDREPTLSKLIKLADFYKMPVDTLACRKQTEFAAAPGAADDGNSRGVSTNESPAYRDNFQEELINGEVVAMSPPFSNHNRVNRNILLIFSNYLDWKRWEPFGYGEVAYLTETDSFLPDFMVVCDPKKIKGDGVHGAPDLVVEVLSPSTAHNDRGRKMEVYADCGVGEYWIISPNEKSVEQYVQSDGQFVLLGVYTVCPDYVWKRLSEAERAAVATEFQCSLFHDLTIRLEDIFKRVK